MATWRSLHKPCLASCYSRSELPCLPAISKPTAHAAPRSQSLGHPDQARASFPTALASRSGFDRREPRRYLARLPGARRTAGSWSARLIFRGVRRETMLGAADDLGCTSGALSYAAAVQAAHRLGRRPRSRPSRAARRRRRRPGPTLRTRSRLTVPLASAAVARTAKTPSSG